MSALLEVRDDPFPLAIAEFDRNPREIIQIALDRYNSRPVSVRIWYRDGDQLEPGKSGLTLSVKHLPAFATGFRNAAERAGEPGLRMTGGAQ